MVLAQSVVDSGAVPMLVLCVQEPELALKRIAASALSDISKHSPELAQTVVDAGAIAHLTNLTGSPDTRIKTQLSQLVVNSGGVAAVVDYIGESEGNIHLPGVMTLGYIAAHSEVLAMSVIVAKGVVQLAIALSEETEDHLLSAWALGQIGRHTPEHAKAVAQANVLPKLLSLYLNQKSSEDLQTKSKKALKNILQRCVHLQALEPLLHDAPPNILKYVVGQFPKVLPHDAKARRLFVTSGGLKKIQEIESELDTLLSEYITAINHCYPEEIVRYYSPGYSEKLLKN